MSRYAFHRIAFAGAVLFGSQFLAQAQTTTTFQSTVTSGIVGLATTETAQLNVFNLQEASTSATSASCQATLELYNTSGTSLGSLKVTIAPGTAATPLSYGPPNARTEIRAVVVTESVLATAGPTVIPVGNVCNIFPSLEIVDSTGGTTHTLTTDFRAVSPSGPEPAVTTVR